MEKHLRDVFGLLAVSTWAAMLGVIIALYDPRAAWLFVLGIGAVAIAVLLLLIGTHIRAREWGSNDASQDGR
jgi:Na+-transporting NADH:ubiquinone oxidoreductase subunit NqrB